MRPSEAALELGGWFRRPHMSTIDDADRELIGAYLDSVPGDGDPRTIAERLDALAEIDRLRAVVSSIAERGCVYGEPPLEPPSLGPWTWTTCPTRTDHREYWCGMCIAAAALEDDR